LKRLPKRYRMVVKLNYKITEKNKVVAGIKKSVPDLNITMYTAEKNQWVIA
jgi:hypothetical protein